MPGLLWFLKVPEGSASLLWGMVRTPFASMQQCLWVSVASYLLVLGGTPIVVVRCVRHRAHFGLLCCAPGAGDDAGGGFAGRVGAENLGSAS
jgi:hypothetical protein